MIRLILAVGALAALLLAAGCASLPPPKERACFAPEWEWSTYVADVLNGAGGSKYTELSPVQVQRWLAFYNAQGEPTGVQYDHIGWFVHPQSPVGKLIMGVGECVWVSATVPLPAMQGFIGAGV